MSLDFFTFLISLAVLAFLILRRFFEIKKSRNSSFVEKIDQVLLKNLNVFFIFLHKTMAKMHVSLIHVLSVKIFGFIKISLDKSKHGVVTTVDKAFIKIRGVRALSKDGASIYVKSMLEHKSRLSRER